jgi:hypothetical protein
MPVLLGVGRMEERLLDRGREGAVKVTAARVSVARNDLSPAAIYAASARHSVNAAERLCL